MLSADVHSGVREPTVRDPERGRVVDEVLEEVGVVVAKRSAVVFLQRRSQLRGHAQELVCGLIARKQGHTSRASFPCQQRLRP